MASSRADEFTASLVTRGDVDMGSILASFPRFINVAIWNNSQRTNRRVYGRYLAASESGGTIFYTQDDDCIVDIKALLSEWEPGKVICNMPLNKQKEYADKGGIALVGWGCLFELSSMSRLTHYLSRFTDDDLFDRECDRIFTALNDVKLVSVPFRELPSSNDANRAMYKEGRHADDLAEIMKRIAVCRA